MTASTAGRILLVDDDERNLKVLEAILHAQGYETERAANGQSAMLMASQQAPDLILLDVMMPDMNGFEVVEKLKSNPATCHIPIIMVTSLDDRESRRYALQAGADEFISKPIDRSELSIRVKNLLMLNKYRRQEERK